MGKEKEVSLGGFWRDLFQSGVYKRTQGRVTRQVTFAALAIIVLIGGWRLSMTQLLGSFGVRAVGALPGLLIAAGLWICFRLVNMPQFADFLIGVEAEMTKVSWPTRRELFHGSVVVIITLVAMAAVLYLFDITWQILLQKVFGIGGG